MSYEVKLTDESGYLRITLTGILTEEVGEELVDQVAAAFFGSDHRTVLIDVRELKLQTSLTQDYQQASYAAAQFAGKSHKIAQLTSQANLQADEFFETVGHNRGMNSRTFTDEAEATAWLLGD